MSWITSPPLSKALMKFFPSTRVSFAFLIPRSERSNATHQSPFDNAITEFNYANYERAASTNPRVLFGYFNLLQQLFEIFRSIYVNHVGFYFRQVKNVFIQWLRGPWTERFRLHNQLTMKIECSAWERKKEPANLHTMYRRAEIFRRKFSAYCIYNVRHSLPGAGWINFDRIRQFFTTRININNRP